ncbi:MAG: hypothetical protein J6B95_05100 [Oscillospiraceae bacterium]|nr:hypothetical protein [Oscillospiraceae bacterium]
MDWVKIRQRGQEAFGKYKYALLILGLGLVLMWLPGEKEESVEEIPTVPAAEQTSIVSQLELILSQIEGVGKVKVMLTESAGEEIVYQTDGDESVSGDSQNYRSDTVIITDSDRSQSGLVRQVNPPGYLGAIIVCQGGDRPSVCLAVVQAVANVTGLGSDRISVLKMK